MNVAVIPARGGSKRIPQKNIKEFCGKPMIAWSIDAAKASGMFDRVVVSTDDDRIQDIALSYGAEVPFVRPQSLADDYATTLAVMRHATGVLLNENPEIDHLCCIYATAPLVQQEALKKAYELIAQDSELDFVFPVTEFDYPIFRGLEMGDNQRVSMLWQEYADTRSQDLEQAYHDVGQFYWGTVKAWQKRENIYTSKTSAVELSSYEVQDIDTPDDWVLAELKFRALSNNKIDSK